MRGGVFCGIAPGGGLPFSPIPASTTFYRFRRIPCREAENHKTSRAKLTDLGVLSIVPIRHSHQCPVERCRGFANTHAVTASG